MNPLIYPFFVRALIAGLAIASTASLLGVFVVARRMAFFSDAIAHASLTGIALGLLLGIHPLIGAIIVCIIVALAMARMAREKISMDTAIGVSFSVAIAAGVILLRSLKGFRVDLFGYLFGDILAVDKIDLIVSIILAVAVFTALAVIGRKLLLLSFNREMAAVSGVNVIVLEYVFMALLAVAVAIGIKLVGVILIGSLMIIPAATAKNIASSFRGMMSWSIFLGLISLLAGLFFSFWFDTPSGPTVVMMSAVLFFFSLFLKRTRC
ncbi:MAG: znuB [Candidatus Magasanikbacteria bacterium]|nr:znuB [Candidatus Magasanikbacteria bacterium]